MKQITSIGGNSWLESYVLTCPAKFTVLRSFHPQICFPPDNQQAQRWIKAGCFEAMAHDLRAILRMAHLSYHGFPQVLCLAGV